MTNPILAFALFAILPQQVQPTTQARAHGAANALDCVRSLRDTEGGVCLEAASVATSGLLFPYPGLFNEFTAPAVVGGGVSNLASGDWAMIGGGLNNWVTGRMGTVAGGRENRANNSYCTVSGGTENFATDIAAAIGGGERNRATGRASTISGGVANEASGRFSTISGGRYGTASGGESTVGGGLSNGASGNYATVAGGQSSSAGGPLSTVSGGGGNFAGGLCATISGGRINRAIGDYSMVAGGVRSDAWGDYSFAAGRRANADHAGSFVWGDSALIDKASSVADEFNVYAGGGTRIFSSSDGTSGVLLAPGGGSWTSVSDRNSKENLEAVDAEAVLEQLGSITISTWNYKSQDDSIRHLGPMAQDFYASFGLGLGEKGIDTIDADGVALVAVQGLNEKVEREIAQKDAEIKELRAELASLKAAIALMAEVER